LQFGILRARGTRNFYEQEETIRKNSGLTGCRIYKDWKAIEYLSSIGSIIHEEIGDLEDL